MAFTSLIEQMRQIILEDSRLDVLTNKYTKAKKKKSGKVVKPKSSRPTQQLKLRRMVILKRQVSIVSG